VSAVLQANPVIGTWCYVSAVFSLYARLNVGAFRPNRSQIS